MQIEGFLEIDEDNGRIYFHNKEGITKMRIQGLPKPDLNLNRIQLIDIKIQEPVITNWKNNV